MSPPPSLVCGKQPGGSPQALGGVQPPGDSPIPHSAPYRAQNHLDSSPPPGVPNLRHRVPVFPRPDLPYSSSGKPLLVHLPHSGLSAQPMMWAEKRGLRPQI